MRFSCRAVAAWQSAAFEWDCVYAVAFNPPLINRLRRWWRTNSMLWHIHRAIHYTYMFSAIYLWCRRCLYSWCSMPQRHLLYLFFFFGLKSQGAAHYQQIELLVFSPIFPLHFFSLLLCVFLFLFFFVKSFLLLFLPSLCAMTSETSRAAGRTCIHSPTIYQFSRGIQC